MSDQQPKSILNCAEIERDETMSESEQTMMGKFRRERKQFFISHFIPEVSDGILE